MLTSFRTLSDLGSVFNRVTKSFAVGQQIPDHLCSLRLIFVSSLWLARHDEFVKGWLVGILSRNRKTYKRDYKSQTKVELLQPGNCGLRDAMKIRR